MDFFSEKNNTFNDKKNNKAITKKSCNKMTNNKYGRELLHIQIILKNVKNVIILFIIIKKNKITNLEKVLERKNIFKNNQNTNINSLFNNRKQVKRFGINNVNNNK